ncbi:hypothetical protein HYW60_00905 [Candidatus Kaiserbacteria bacterium]|nr:hypothetical protein [Candidatus Kaiserbacteria bacterium]
MAANISFLKRIVRYKNVRFIVAVAVSVLILGAVAIALSYVPLPAERLFVSHAGYTLRYPADWIIGEVRRDSSYESELIREPLGRATIVISSHRETRLQERTGRAAVAKETELGFTGSPNYSLDFFGWITPEAGAEYNGYVASGLFDNSSGQYVFKEIGILDPAGSKVTFRTEVLAAHVDELGPTVDAALLSVRGGGSKRIVERDESAPRMSADEAKALVERLPDFALYRDSALERGMGYVLEAEDAGSLWKVRLYVGGSSSGRTLPIPLEQWKVDKSTGAVSKTVF